MVISRNEDEDTMNKISSPVFPRFVRSSQKTMPQLIAFFDNGAKRLVDICAAFLGLLILSPFFLVVGFLIKRDTPGPVFYGGPRVGKGGCIFHILKFRTMNEPPLSSAGPRVTAQDDPRITRLGRWLRDSKLNELPQLWNVLVGEMSLVGPRPEDTTIVKTWDENIRREVLSVRPGITSPASVLYRDEESLLNNGNVMRTYINSVLPSKLRLDQLYVRHRSFLLDLDILFWTVLVLLPLVRTIAPSEDSLFLGPISRLMRRYISWFVIDMIVTLISIVVTGIVWRFFTPLNVGVLQSAIIAFGLAWLYTVTSMLLGMDRIAWSQAWASDAIGLVVSVVIATGLVLVLNQFWSTLPIFPPMLIVIAAVLSLGGYVLTRYRSRLITGFASRWLERTGGVGATRERVLIVGGGSAGQFVTWLLGNGSTVDLFKVIGYIDDDLYKQGRRYHGVNVLGRRADIPRLVDQHDVGLIVFAIHNIDHAERRALLELCRRTSASVVEVPDIAASLNAAIAAKSDHAQEEDVTPHEKLNGFPLFTSSGIPPVQAQLWLADLERLAKKGDLGALNERIDSIRDEIQDSQTLPI